MEKGFKNIVLAALSDFFHFIILNRSLVKFKISVIYIFITHLNIAKLSHVYFRTNIGEAMFNTNVYPIKTMEASGK